jgi:hypothetical protein
VGEDLSQKLSGHHYKSNADGLVQSQFWSFRLGGLLVLGGERHAALNDGRLGRSKRLDECRVAFAASLVSSEGCLKRRLPSNAYSVWLEMGITTRELLGVLAGPDAAEETLIIW